MSDPTLCQEIRRFVAQIQSCSSNPAVLRASDQIETLCAAYLEPDQQPGLKYKLGPSEGRIFELLLKRRGQAVSRESLMAVCRHIENVYADPQIVSVHISRVRRTLAKTEYAGKIETVHGIGYKLAIGDAP